MRVIKVDNSKYYIFIYKPSGSYIAIEKKSNPVFEKLLIIYDNEFEKISDNHFVNAFLLSYDEKSKTHSLKNLNHKLIKVNDLCDLPAKTKLFLKLINIFSL